MTNPTKYQVLPGGQTAEWKRHSIAELQKMTLEERYWHYVIKGENEDDCWQWMAMKSADGYGAIRNMGKRLIASRYSYEYHNNTIIPKGLLVCHSCDNPPCTNPKHLFLGTMSDNIMDASRKGLLNRAKGEKSGRAKLNNEQVIEIFRSTENPKILAAYYGVEIKAITRIKSGINWSHITKTL